MHPITLQPTGQTMRRTALQTGSTPSPTTLTLIGDMTNPTALQLTLKGNSTGPTGQQQTASQRDQPYYPTDEGAYRRYSEAYHPAAERRYDEPRYPAAEVDNQYDSRPPHYMYEERSDDQRPGKPYYQRFAPYAGDAPRNYVDSPNYQELPYRGTDAYRPYDYDERRHGADERPYDQRPYETEEVESPRYESPSDYNDRDHESESDRDVEYEPPDEGNQFEGDRYDKEYNYPCGEAEEGEGDEGDSKYNKHTSPHLILLVRSTITLQEWGLGKLPNIAKACCCCAHCSSVHARVGAAMLLPVADTRCDH